MTTVKVVPSSSISSPFSSKTVLGALAWCLGFILDSHLLGAAIEPVLRAAGEVLQAAGGLIAAIGIWHGQQKVKQTVALNSPSPEPKVVP